MAKPNFSFQKRQKELARQKKNEEKRQRKLQRSAAPAKTDGEPPSGSAAAEQDADRAGAEDQNDEGQAG